MQVSEIDALPKFICIVCFDKVHAFNEFYGDVRKAQETFLQSVRTSEEDDYCFPDTNEIIDETFIELPLECNDDTNGTNIVKGSVFDSEFTTDDMNAIMDEYLDDMDDVSSVADFESIEESDVSG